MISINFQVTIDFPAIWLVEIDALWASLAERVQHLRELVVKGWLGEYSNEYEMFLTVADRFLFYEMA